MAWFAITTAHAVEGPTKGRLLFLGVAYDEGPGKGQTIDNFNYAPDNFATLFAAQARELYSEIKVETLKGSAATREAVGGKLRALQRAARRNDLVFLYWGTHGGTDAKGWGANLPGDAVVLGTEIKAELAKVACPVIVVISTCGSGGFIRTKAKETDLPANTAAFCACQRRQSTTNELDISLLEALAGFGDINHDGLVTLQEAIDYVPRRYRSLLKDSDDPSMAPVLGHSEGVPLDRPLAKVANTHVAVVHEGYWYGASILERSAGRAKVRFLGYDSTSPKGGFAMLDEVVKDEMLELPGGFPPVEVEQGGEWYPAVILERAAKGFKIHYVGYPASDDEEVPLKRMRFPFGGRPEELKGARQK